MKCNRYRKLKNLIISYILNKELILCIICDMCGSKVRKIFKEEKWIEVLKVLDLINNTDD